jgi:hypothetical protein
MRMREEDGHIMMEAASRAWATVKETQVLLWEQWILEIGPGLMEARTEAMSVAQTNTPMGRAYSTAMSELLEEYGLDDMSKTARAHLLKIMEHYHDVEEWRNLQKDPDDLNHPSRVWVKFQRSSKQADAKTKRKRSAVKDAIEALAQALKEIEQKDARIKELEEECAQLRRNAAADFETAA